MSISLGMVTLFLFLTVDTVGIVKKKLTNKPIGRVSIYTWVCEVVATVVVTIISQLI